MTIYIEHEPGIKLKSGKFMYLLEHINRKGEPVTRTGIRFMNDATADRMTLAALITALEKIKPGIEIKLNLPAGGVRNAYLNGWINKWIENDWKINDKPVKNSKLWQRALESLDKFIYSIDEEPNSYKNWMQKQIKEKEFKNADEQHRSS